MKHYVELNELVKCLLDVKDKGFTDILIAVLNIPTVELDDSSSTLNNPPYILNEPIYTNPCQGCAYYNAPYWSIQSPCLSCPRGIYGGTITATNMSINDKPSTTTTTEIRKD